MWLSLFMMKKSGGIIMDQREMQIDRQYEELIQRIDELDEDSFEKRELSSRRRKKVLR